MGLLLIKHLKKSFFVFVLFFFLFTSILLIFFHFIWTNIFFKTFDIIFIEVIKNKNFALRAEKKTCKHNKPVLFKFISQGVSWSYLSSKCGLMHTRSIPSALILCRWFLGVFIKLSFFLLSLSLRRLSNQIVLQAILEFLFTEMKRKNYK